MISSSIWLFFAFEGLDLLQNRLIFLVRLDLEEPLPRPFQGLLSRLQLGILFPPAFSQIFQLLPLGLHNSQIIL